MLNLNPVFKIWRGKINYLLHIKTSGFIFVTDLETVLNLSIYSMMRLFRLYCVEFSLNSWLFTSNSPCLNKTIQHNTFKKQNRNSLLLTTKLLPEINV